MSRIPVCVVFDAGKTNKKVFVFDENYHVVFERSARFLEIEDEDGDPCENLESLKVSVLDTLSEILKREEFEVKAVNFSAYGASLVYIDENGNPVAPLYNYLKNYPEVLKSRLCAKYGGEKAIAATTSSPVTGSLNSGMQLYRIKNEKPEIYQKIRYALHLPQYLSYLVSGLACSEMTSIGCHTLLWDFKKNEYHEWVKEEGLDLKLAPIVSVKQVFPAITNDIPYQAGVGLHDSSAALIPYLINFHHPFVLISTGTWCITLNPFNSSPLTAAELELGCLSYIQYQGKPVKASRIFAGYEHDQQVKRIAEHFRQSVNRYRNMKCDADIIRILIEQKERGQTAGRIDFKQRNLSVFSTDTLAYHELIFDIALQQYISSKLVLGDYSVKRIFVDGGFSKNEIYMNFLARMFSGIAVFAASMAQATAIGTALAIHKTWNTKLMPDNLIELKYYAAPNDFAI